MRGGVPAGAGCHPCSARTQKRGGMAAGAGCTAACGRGPAVGARTDRLPTRDVVRDESGAIAIIVAILLIILLGLTAFVVDFGMAYNNKVQLQISADAAALAAAVELKDRGASCPVVSAADTAAAQGAAASLMAENHPGATQVGLLGVTCTFPGHNGKIVVSWENEATTDTVFGGIYGVDTITPSRRASAAVPEGGGGLRPLALCINELPGVGSVGRVNFDGHNSDGGCDGLSGNWRSTDCPESDNNGNPAYIAAVENGCQDPVVPVPGVPSGSLRQHLLDACPSGPGPGASDDDCLGGNTGQVFGGQISDAWEGLLDVRFTLPVICGPTLCTPVAAQGSGNTGQYPVYRLADVTLCAEHRKNQATSYGASPECAGASSQDGLHKDNWLIIQLNGILGPGDPLDPVLTGGSVLLVE